MATPPLPPSHPLLLLLISTFFLLSSATTTTLHNHPHHPSHHNSTANTTNANTSFIWDSCQTTEYPKLCFHCLSPFAAEIHRSSRRLALTALALSLSRARATARFVHSLQSGRGVHVSHQELEAVKDCVDTMGDSVDQLARSIRELGQMDGGDDFMFRVSNVQTWVSAALTNENTCVEGLYEQPPGPPAGTNGVKAKEGNEKIKGAIKMRVNNVAQVTSNALALVNHFADKYQAAFDKIRSKHPKKP